jgi:hypothetical protein
VQSVNNTATDVDGGIDATPPAIALRRFAAHSTFVAVISAGCDGQRRLVHSLTPPAGARLIEQYQAQLVSALRAALSPTAGPMLSMAGGALATLFLESGLAAGERVTWLHAMGSGIRMLSLLTSCQATANPASGQSFWYMIQQVNSLSVRHLTYDR